MIELFELPPDDSNIEGDNFIEIEDTAGYQVAYSQLNYAQSKREDPLSEIADGRKYLIEELSKLRHPDIPGHLAQMPVQHQEALQKYCAQAGIKLM